MNKKIFLAVLFTLIAACSSNKKLDYIVTDYSTSKKPIWVDNIVKYEKNKESESNKYKYFRAEGNSINRRLCQKSALDNTNITIAGEISTEVDNTYKASIQTDENTLLNNQKEEKTKTTIKNNLSGVEPKDTYWEKRKYLKDLGADKDGVFFYCYQLSRVKREVHEKLIEKMVDDQLKSTKNKKTNSVVEENTKKMEDIQE